MLLAGSSRLSGGNKSVPSLTIKSVEQTDMGYYICQATDGKTTVNSFIIVLSPKVPPTLAVHVPITQYSPQVFTDITLQCIITSGVPTSVEWHVDNIPINLENDGKYSGGTTNNASLTIMSVQQSDRGYYMCFASDGFRTVNSDIITLLPVGTEPVVMVPQTSYTQIVGETITINCEVQSQNSILQEVQWIFIDNEGARIDPINVIMSQNLKYQGSSISSPSLTIFHVQPSDAGKYGCRARNMMGTTVSDTFASLVIPEVPVVRISKSLNSVNRGEEIILECTASSNVAIRQIFWIKEASGNINVVENKHYESSFFNPFLTISDVGNDDEGLYTCFASNSVGIGSSQQTVLNVIGNANITITELFFEQETALRESIVVICKAYVMYPEGTVFATWKLNNSVINPTSTSKWIPETFTSNPENLERMQFRLTVIDPEPSDSGQLTCGVSDGYASSEKTVSLNVIGKPIVSISPRTSTVTLGDTVNITCTTDQSYSDYAYIEWYKNGDILLEKNGEIIKRMDNGHSQLIIYDIQDTAQYECYGINSYGRGNRVISHISVIKPDVVYQYCPDNFDLFESLWIYTIENTLFIKSCPGDRTGTVSRYCNSDGEWEDSNYSKCITKGFSTLEEQSELLKNGVEVKEVNSILLNLLQLTDPDVLGGLTSGELDSSSKILENIAIHAKERTESISVDQLEIFLSACNNLLVGKNMQGWKQLKQLNLKGVTRIANAATIYTKAYTNVNDSVFQKTVQKDQLVVQVGKVLYEDIIFPKETQMLPNWITESTNKVTLSKDNFKGKQPVGYSITYYRNISNLFHELYLSKGAVTSFNGSYDVNSVVIDFSLEPTPTSLQRPLIIKFEHVQVNHSFPVCAFWDFNALNTPNGAWSFSGSKLVTTSDGVTVCQYAHTTNFALLMSPGRAPSSHSLVLSIISTIGCVVSIIFLVITVIIYAILWRPLTRDTRGRNLKRDKAVLLVNFCVALTISYILFLAGVTRTGNKKVCTAIAVLLHYIFLVDISFMLAEGIELAISVLFVFATSSRIKWLIPLCWVAPAVIVGISMGATKLEGYGNSQYCWLSIESDLIWAFIGPALTVILINFIILMLVIKTMFATHAMMDKTTKERAKAGVRSVCVILPLFGVTWVLGVLSVNEDTVMFQYLFAVFNSLQGFFIFVFHAALNQQVREKIHLPAMRKKKSTYRIYSKQISQSTTATRESFASSGTESVADLSDFNDIFKTIERDESHVSKYQGNEEMNFKRNNGFAPNRDPISLSEMPGHVKTGNRREKYVVNKSGSGEGDRKQNPSDVSNNVVLRRIVKAHTVSSGKQNQNGGTSDIKDISRRQYKSQTVSGSDNHYDSPVMSNDETTRISMDNHSFKIGIERHRISDDYQHQKGDKISWSTYF